MFWDGSRWIDERAHDAEQTKARRNAHKRRPPIFVVGVALAALAAPGLSSAQPVEASYRSSELLAAWGSSFDEDVIQESAGKVDTSGTWLRRNNAGFLGGRVLTSWQRGATISLRFTGSGIAVVGPTSRHRGRVRISIDGEAVATVKARSHTYRRRATVYATSFDAEETHTISVTVLGQSRHTKTSVDAFIVRHPKDRDTGLQPPTPTPTDPPTLAPTAAPTLAPTAAPTLAPTAAPTLAPTAAPTLAPTAAPTLAPTAAPTLAPTGGARHSRPPRRRHSRPPRRSRAPTGDGMLLSSSEIRALPTQGPAWTSLLAWADKTAAPAISDQDDASDVIVLAKALVDARTGQACTGMASLRRYARQSARKPAAGRSPRVETCPATSSRPI